MERRGLLEELLEDHGIGPPLQAVPTTTDVATARLWYDSLKNIGIEGLVVKAGSSVYRGGSRQWRKIRHAETVDAAVVGYTGPAARPRHLAVRLPDGRTALSQTLTSPLSAQVAPYLVASGRVRRARTRAGDAYNAVGVDVLVEVSQVRRDTLW
nr:hypothetical protein [Streptomyces sp. alain-838]